MKINIGYLFVLVSILLTACKKDDTITKEKEVTHISDKYFKPGEYPLVQDSIYDVKKSFINLDQLEVNILEDSIIIKMTVANLPSVLTFNQTSLPMNRLNYQWAVNFDLNDDEENSRGDISISISKFKFSGEETGPILSNTQENIWEMDYDGSHYLIDLSDYVKIINNSFLIRIPKNNNEKLKRITPDANVYFESFYSDGKTTSHDYFPSRYK